MKETLEEKGGYVVYATALIGADLVIKKSDWTGMAVKVKSTDNGTEILFNPFAPSMLVRLLFMGLIPLLVLMFGAWKTFGQEFISWVEQEQPFGG